MAKSKEDGNSRTGIHDLKHLSKIDIEAGSGDFCTHFGVEQPKI